MAHILTDFDIEVALTTARRMPDSSPNRQVLWFSASVVGQTFGWEWGRARLFDADSKDLYLNQDLVNKEVEGESRASSRLVEVANLILCLKDRGGVDEVFNRLQTGNFEQALFELRFAAILNAVAIPFRFNTIKGQKGRDFDLWIKTPGEWTPVELKYKVASTELRPDAIWKTLKKAKEQLPTNEYGTIVLSLPSKWVSSEQLDEILQVDTMKFFRQDTRIRSVIFILTYEDDTRQNFLAHHEFRNPIFPPSADFVLPWNLYIDPDILYPAYKMVTGVTFPLQIVPLKSVNNPISARLAKLKI